MWQLLNRTPYAVERGFVRDVRGRELWVVVVKGTFRIRSDGRAELDEPQPPVTVAPRYHGVPGRSSLRADTDLVLGKPGTDVLVLGRAHAPKGKPAPRVEVGIRCGTIAKTLVVHGDRTYRRGAVNIVPSAAAPFTEMPILYERAFGGVDPLDEGAREPRNPAGVGFAARPERLVGLPVPNIEYPGEPVTSAEDRPAPAGLGPIARDWAPRLARAGTYDEAWHEERAPLWPEDLDERFFCAAPEDQQIPGYLREGSRVELVHLTPDGLFSFELPRTRPAFRTAFGRDAVEHRGRLHTVEIEPDARRVSMVWHTAVPCQGKDHRIEHTRIWEKRYV